MFLRATTRTPQISPALWLAGIAFSICAFPGCSRDETVVRPAANVSGVVTYNGEAVNEGTVVFEDPKTGTVKGGDLGPEGKFQISKVPLGTYAVSIVPKSAPFTPPADDPAKKAPEPDAANIPAKYRLAKTSTFTADVKEGQGNQFTFKME